MSAWDALMAERFGPSLWWKSPEPPADTELMQAHRRKVLMREVEEHAAKRVERSGVAA